MGPRTSAAGLEPWTLEHRSLGPPPYIALPEARNVSLFPQEFTYVLK
jgi:hypothetical protein